MQFSKVTTLGQNGDNRKSALGPVYLAIPLLAFVAFYRSFGLYRFHDGWTFVYRAHAALANAHALQFMLRPFDQHWSPLWHLTEMVNCALAGWESDTFIRLLTLLTYIGSLSVFVLISRRFEVSNAAVLAGLVIVGLHPTSAVTLYSFACYSQCVADLLSWGAALLFIYGLPIDSPGELRPGPIWGGVAILAVALLFKEQALAGLAVNSWLLALAFLKNGGRKERAAILTAFAALVAVGTVFAAIRAGAGTPMQFSGAFHVSPAHIPGSASMLFGALLSPVPLLFWRDALHSSGPVRTVHILLYGALCVGVCTYLAAGIIRSWKAGDRPRLHVTLVSGALVLSWFPAAMLAHVGELYVHSGLMWFALMVALVTDMFLKGPSRLLRRSLMGLFLIWAVVSATNLRSLLGEVRATGERSRTWLERIGTELAHLPNGSLVVIDADGDAKPAFDYGLYRLSRPQYLVLTGIRPWAVRWVVNDRLTAVLREAVDDTDVRESPYHQELIDHYRMGIAYHLKIAGDGLQVTRCASPQCDR
jgi:hypothetical protein